MQWSRNTNVIKSFIVVGLLALSAGGANCADEPVTGDLAPAKTSGKESGALAAGRFGTPDTLNQNLNVPMTSSENQMFTLDGSEPFSAALGIPSSNKFLEIIIQPSGSGDLANVIIAQDLTADGLFDHTFTLGKPVSGVCSNGFISCSLGTWNNCESYGWNSDSSGKLSVQLLDSVSRLNGCFCINSSCGSNLAWTNSGIILQALGGGAVGSVRVQDASTTITNVAMTPVMITYHGQLVRQAGTAVANVPNTATLPGTSPQQSYYSNWSNLDAERDNITLNQASDPNSLYYQLNNSSAATSAQMRTCNVTRTGRLEKTVEYESGSGSSPLYTHHYVDMQVLVTPDQQTYKLQLLDYNGGTWHCGNASALPDHEPMDTNGFHSIYQFTLPTNTNSYQRELTSAVFTLTPRVGTGCGAGGSAFIVDVASFGFNTRINTGIDCGNQRQRPTFDWTYNFEFTKEEYLEAVSNGCTAMEADSSCTLKTEKIDGVPTVSNYAPTGLNQLPSSKDFYGQFYTPLQIWRPWWQKQREYSCTTTPTAFNLTRYQNVKDTISANGTSFAFDDYRQGDDGTWSSVSMDGTLPQADVYETCIPSCKVKRPISITDVTLAGSVSTNMVNNSSFETRYLTCINNTCPVVSGDEVVPPCSCIDEFPQAASIMQSMRLSGADTICSGGTASPP